MSNTISLRILLPTLPLFFSPTLEEGMWTFDNPPREILKQRYQFEPSAEWLEHVRLSSVRFNDGGSGSFVSPRGLVLTNHHVGLRSIQKLSTEERDYVKEGFYAPTFEEELSCPDLELNVLISMENVTSRVQGAVRKGASEQKANEQRKAEIANIEKEESEKTSLRCDVLSLYRGGEYWLYRYKKYKNIKLVFAPEQQTAFFGGDPDNFTFPRYNLDFAFFRVYGEDGKPIQNEHYFNWSQNGAGKGELVFVSGNPGSSGRLQTLAQLDYTRNYSYPRILKSLKRRHTILKRYSEKGEEQARRAKTMLFGIENAIKAFTGYQESLLNPRIMKKKEDEERAFRARISKDAVTQRKFGDAWYSIEKTRTHLATFSKQLAFSRLQGRLWRTAQNIVRLTEEIEKPNEKRFPEYRDSALDSLKLKLYSPAPIYRDLEELLLSNSLAEALENLGPEDPYIQAALQGKRPQEVAQDAIQGTKLPDVGFRKKLVEGGRKAVKKSTDPLIALARRVDPLARKLRKKYEDEVQAVESIANEKIAKARFAAFGKVVYPDATFTLRLSYGVVEGYKVAGTLVPYKTTFHGLFERNSAFENKPPFDLPERFYERKGALDLSTPLNFVCTTDIIGGNSGSPVLNRAGQIVGLIFDGNIQSLGNRFVYDEENARAVAVHSAAIPETLRKIYDADTLAEEIEHSPPSMGGL